jgi:lysylphosphatidylglycerol synthetase-like protein (DUF2156 family)
MKKLISLLGIVIFGGIAVVVATGVIYAFLTDGIANVRGEGEAGWAAMIALILGVPIIAMFSGVALFCYKQYKKNYLPTK